MLQRLRSVFRRTTTRSDGTEKWYRRSYAQEGEDLIIDRLLAPGANGLYVDIGAHHPLRFSNTYMLYLKGWSGVCVDPLPGAREAFRQWRPRDTFVEEGVSASRGELTYYAFNEPALNTFDPELAAERNGVKGYAITEVVKIMTRPLSSILDEFVPPSQEIEVMSVDVEGLDLEVLQSNDWSRFSPKLLVAECYCEHLSSLANHPIVEYLSEKGYAPLAKTGHSVVFTRDHS